MTRHRHLPSDHYLRTFARRQRPSATAMLVLDALAAVCPECGRTLELLAGERDRLPDALRTLDRRPGEIGAAPVDADPPATARELDRLADEVARLRRQRRRWKLDLWELGRLPRKGRRARVEEARSRFSSAGLAELLTETAGELLASDPAEAASLAALTPSVLGRVPREETEPWALTLIVRAGARHLDALRRGGELDAAERTLRRLHAHLAAHPDPPPELAAEVAAREAFLLVDRQRPDEADERLQRAARGFRTAGDGGAEAAVALRRAILRLDRGRRDTALEVFERVTARLRADDPQALRIVAVSGLVVCLCDAARGEEAERLLATHVEAFEDGGELLAGALYRGLEAQVHSALGRTDRAAAALAACRTAHRALERRYAGPLAAIRRIAEDLPLPSRTAGGAPAAGRPDPRLPDDSPHLPLDACLAVCRGELHPAPLLRRAHRHLLDLCPGCRAEWEAARAAAPDAELFAGPSLHPPGLRPLPADPRRLLAADVESREELLSRLRLERRRAREDLALLQADPPWERPVRCAAARTRFASPALAELLIEAARTALPGDPDEAASLAGLVSEVLGDVPGRDTAWWHELSARAEGELARAEAAVRRTAGRTREAEELLDRAVRAYRDAGDEAGEAGSSADLSRLLREDGRAEEALARLERAAALVPAAGEPTAALEILLRRAGCLCDLGRIDAADRLLAAHRELAVEAAGFRDAAVLCGLRGRIELGRGRRDLAAEAFEAGRSGHLTDVRTFDALLATLDLARTRLREGRAAELARLAADGAPLGREAGADRECLAAFALQYPAGTESRRRDSGAPG